jgi:hypothetical protein
VAGIAMEVPMNHCTGLCGKNAPEGKMEKENKNTRR